jgi:recombination protein RecR
MYPNHLIKLIEYFKKLPGIGSKTAERFAFHLIKWRPEELHDFSNIIGDIKIKILTCSICGCLLDDQRCDFCDTNKRMGNCICVVSSFKDVFALEQTKSYKGLYHVIDNLLSPIDGKELDLDKLIKRIETNNITEMIIALDSTLEGDTTALYIKEKLSNYNLNISRLAFGMPIGSSLEYIDKSTLTQAFVGRQSF